MSAWKEFQLTEKLLTVVEGLGHSTPTEIQLKALPPALLGKDIIGSAPTGTGKTLSFVLPMCQKLLGRSGTLALVLAPTREIALQIQDTFSKVGPQVGLNSACLIGGVDYRFDEKALANYPQVIIGTPGRLCDHLEKGNLWLDYLEVVVLDEADRMLDMGFATQLDMLLNATPKTRQTLLFSATFTPSVEALARKILHEPERITVGQSNATKAEIIDELVWLDPDSKQNELLRVLRAETGSILIFVRSKDGASRLWRWIHSRGFHKSAALHSDMPQKFREQALEEFKKGNHRILVATDVAARGLHVDDVSLVVNFDVPLEADSYTHRVGRTGRAGKSGKAVTFATSRDVPLIKDIERFISRSIPAVFRDGLSADNLRGSSGSSRPRSGFGGGGGRGGRSGRGSGRSGARR